MIRIIGLVGFLTVLGFAQPSQLIIQPDSKMWIAGESTVRSFTCLAAAVEGSVASAASGSLSLDNLEAAVISAELTIPVGRLACGNGTMDGHMKKALKAQEHESIVFRMDGYSASAPEAGVSTLELRGTLRIAGTDRPITMTAQATQEVDGTLRIQGKQPITMSQWGVKPPSLMLGTMKVRDDVVVNFDIRLRQQ